MSDAPVIAIDGPSGSGKGAAAAMVAARLGFGLLDSGALYRTLGLAAAKSGADPDDASALARLAAAARIEFDRDAPGSVRLDGEDVSLEIRTEAGGELASRVAALPAARRALLPRQLAFRRRPGLVADGRDMGTVVFPDALVKVFLTASPEARAERRYKQLMDKGISANLGALLRDQAERDARDSERAVSPLAPAEDAVVIDTTSLTLEQVVERIMALVAEAPGIAAPGRT